MDLLLINGNIRTIDSKNPIAEAVAIMGNKIQKVGSTEDVLALKTDKTKVVDLGGKTVVPGFNDSHMHLLNYGYALMQADLNFVESIDEINNRVSAYISTNDIEKGKWVRGRGWNHDYFSGEKRFPTRYDLDKISTEYPIAVTRTCGHAVTVNSKALEVLNINSSTPQVEGGHFDLDDNGEPLGIFRENALGLVYDAIPTPSLEEVKKMIINAIKDLNKYGITSVQTDDFQALPGNDYEIILKAYLELEEEGNLNVRVYEQCLLPEIDNLKAFYKKGYMTGWGDDNFKIGPLKLLIDGSLGARTAALNEPYNDDPSTSGIITATQEELNELVRFAHNNDNQIAIHGIGDRGMYMSFEAIEKALVEKPRKNHRHGIVHAQITDEYLLNKFEELEAVAYIQPFFLDYDWKIVRDRVGEMREKTSYNWKTMLDKGIHAACGSDAPVDFFNVLNGIYEAVTRKDIHGKPEGGWLIDQALTVEQALYGYTLEGAYTSFQEDLKGSIEAGKLADLIVLSQDIFSIPSDEIKDVVVEMTIFDGKILDK